jgi:hypothetical protein
VRTAIVELLEIVELISIEPERRTYLREDAEQTILRLIAGIVLADGQFSSQEQDFLSVLINVEDKTGRQPRYLNEYAAKWNESRETVPEFFRVAREHDRSCQTKLTHSMVREIQLIGNNVAVCNFRTSKKGEAIVRQYVALLNEFLEDF